MGHHSGLKQQTHTVLEVWGIMTVWNNRCTLLYRYGASWRAETTNAHCSRSMGHHGGLKQQTHTVLEVWGIMAGWNNKRTVVFYKYAASWRAETTNTQCSRSMEHHGGLKQQTHSVLEVWSIMARWNNRCTRYISMEHQSLLPHIRNKSSYENTVFRKSR